MLAPESVLQLIERFDRNKDAYRSGQYNETQVRREFIDPFFKALGWDIDNEQGWAEAYKDVVHEDAIKVGGFTKAPDYCFRIGGARKFFVEAKKPSINVKEDLDPAFQVRRYAWSAKLPLSIVTDFEELAVYDCRVKPQKTDKASVARVLYLRYTDYQAQWGSIADVFSRESILRGSFDKYAESTKAKRGTTEVDAAFLQEIESWREQLAQNIALRNPKLTQRELNYAVQVTIDRIIFLRICEDRGIEDYKTLIALLGSPQVYGRLLQLFERADQKYNSGLFHFLDERNRAESPDELTPKLVIDDKPLKEILSRLYYPDCPYEFAVLPANILGQVYEQFLGKVIRLTAGHRAVVEDKPEVKKAGGVFYTPTYIVDYIVKQTVGKLTEGKKPKDVGKLQILDPACGSGSFLIGAYDHLLNWHRDWYVNEGPEKFSKQIYQGSGGVWRLTTSEKKRILLNNIYGVDIDAQAVEVTKLSLLLKVLEGESQETLMKQLSLLRERALPDLSANIKCGNSLIGPDYYENVQMRLLDEEENYRINVFDWHAGFPDIFNGPKPGFDAVIGNPPYVRMEGFKDLKGYLGSKFFSHDARSDLYVYFIEEGHKLLAPDGLFGMIVSNKFLRANYGQPLRDFLTQNSHVERVVDFAGLPVFVGATVRTIILLTSKNIKAPKPTRYSPPPPMNQFTRLVAGSLSVQDLAQSSERETSPEMLGQSAWGFGSSDADKLLGRLQVDSVPLVKYCDGHICRGIVSGLAEAFVIDEATRAGIVGRNPKSAEIIKPFINGRDVRRWTVNTTNKYLLYMFHGVRIHEYPEIEEQLRPFKSRLEARATRQKWYELQQPQYNYVGYMDGPKIVFPDIAKTPRFALDEASHYCSNTVYFIPGRDLYLLGLLNSRLAHCYFISTCAALEGRSEAYLRFFGQYLERFPVRPIGPSNSTAQQAHDEITALSSQMIELSARLGETQTSHEKTVLQNQIDVVDHQINALVYELYGLTEDEIKIVEASLQ